MIVHDVLYGRFELPSFLGPLLTAPEFRRLAEVRLININSPALSALAEVRRYSHTLGVLRLTLENPLTNFGESEHRALLASIIVHDAGTPAFAHLFEYQLSEQFQWDHETVVPAILTKQHHADARLHQFHAYRRPEFEELCRVCEIDFDVVLEILEHRHPGSKLVFGSVDFDNLDNVARMNWMLGNHFDLNVVLNLAGSLGADDTADLLLPQTQRCNLETWAALRRQAYEVLVFDGPTVAGQAVLSSLIYEALQTGTLSVDDWNYTDHKLLEVLQSMSPEAKDRLQRDFLGALPELRLLVQITDTTHPIFAVSRHEVADLIKTFLTGNKVTRSYGYSLRDRGTFEKRITAVDPSSGSTWSVGKRSDSLVLYGFGGGGRKRAPQVVGREFLDWYEKKMLNSTDTTDSEARALLRRFGEIDWDFTAQSSESAFSSFHWHPCRFPSQIPALAIGRMSPTEGLVLDPFMGSATTLVEAQRLGRPSIGIDLNPVSCLLGAAKTLAEDASEVVPTINALRLTIAASWDTVAPAPLPASVQGGKWYMPSTLAGLQKLWTISSEAQGIGGIVARACFSAVLLSACREDRHWGYVCDNTKPKGDRAPEAKEIFLAVLHRIAAAYAERSKISGSHFPKAQIINADAAAALSELPADHVDCVVTSPPYFGVTDYVKAQRLTMEWLSEEIEPVRRREIGARSKRHRISALDDYLLDLDSVFRQVHRVLKEGAVAIIVFGQSPSRPDVQGRFVDNLRALGFTLQLDRDRHIPVGRRQMPSVSRETVLVVRK